MKLLNQLKKLRFYWDRYADGQYVYLNGFGVFTLALGNLKYLTFANGAIEYRYYQGRAFHGIIWSWNDSINRKFTWKQRDLLVEVTSDVSSPNLFDKL